MKVAVVTSFPFPNGKATANRVRVFAEEILKVSSVSIVEVVCCSDQQSNTSVFTQYIRVSNIQVAPLNKNRLISRAIHELRLAAKLWARARATDADLIIVTIPSILLLVPVVFSKRENLIALDVRDAVWTYLGEGIMSRIASSIMKKIFFLAAKRAKIISVTNSQEAKHVESITGIKPLVIGNGISKIRFDEMRSLDVKPLKNVIKLAYIGNVGIAQEIDRLLYFAKETPDLEITIVGDGAKLEELQAQCIVDGIHNIVFTGFVPPDVISRYILSADILFAQIGLNFRSAVPTKIFEYVASGRRVLLGLPEGPAREIFANFHGVEVFNVGDNKGFKASYKKLLETEFNEEMRWSNLHILEQRYLRENNAKNLIQAIEEICHH
jgi:glycosyltransferase involved in cell wall biosynthesis